MKITFQICAAASVLAMASCAASPRPVPVSGASGQYGNDGYGDRNDRGRYGDNRYGDGRYDNGRYGDGRYNDDHRYDSRRDGERQYDERARRYYYFDSATGNTYWVNGDFRSR